MVEKELMDIIQSIEASDKDYYKKAKDKWDRLFKIKDSLGKLEELSSKICAMREEIVKNLDKKAMVIFVGDNGVVDEGVAMTPKDHTIDLTKATIIGKTAIGAMTDCVGAEQIIVDMGLFEPVEGTLDLRLGEGTKNLFLEPAMTRETCVKGLLKAIDLGNKLYKDYDIIGVGELGMGNTTTSSLLLRGLTGLDAELITGKGGGVSDEGFERKKEIVAKALEKNNTDLNDPIDILAKVGGFEHVGMVGIYLSAALNKKPIVMDGMISSVSALLATRLNENVKDYLIPSHMSTERAAPYIMDELKLEPGLNLDMRLGEGVGCPIMFQVLDIGFYLLNNMYTAAEANVDINSYIDIYGKRYNLDNRDD